MQLDLTFLLNLEMKFGSYSLLLLSFVVNIYKSVYHPGGCPRGLDLIVSFLIILSILSFFLPRSSLHMWKQVSPCTISMVAVGQVRIASVIHIFANEGSS